MSGCDLLPSSQPRRRRDRALPQQRQIATAKVISASVGIRKTHDAPCHAGLSRAHLATHAPRVMHGCPAPVAFSILSKLRPELRSGIEQNRKSRLTWRRIQESVAAVKRLTVETRLPKRARVRQEPQIQSGSQRCPLHNCELWILVVYSR